MFAGSQNPGLRPVSAETTIRSSTMTATIHINQKTGKPFKRGLIPTSRADLAAAMPFRQKAGSVPDHYFAFPLTMSMWGNDEYGDCVSAEEAMNKAVGGIFVSDADVIAWASKNGDLNGANLQPVIQQMAAAGMPSGSGIFGDGGPGLAVNWTNTDTLQAAIYEMLTASPAGTVKIGLAADQLPTGAGNAQGWFLVAASPENPNAEDHCMCYCGYGTAQQFIDAINAAFGLSLTVPTGVNPATEGYAAYTWSTIGFFDAATNQAIVFEAWARQPSTTVQSAGTPVADTVYVTGGTPPPPPPPPTPPPPPPPPPPPTPPAPSPMCNRPIVLIAETILAYAATLSTIPAWLEAFVVDAQSLLAALCPTKAARFSIVTAVSVRAKA
jgi:hypothetical protein